MRDRQIIYVNKIGQDSINERQNKWRKDNIEHCRAQDKKYRAKYYHKRLANNAKRRAQLLNAIPKNMTKEELKSIENLYRMAKRKSEVEGRQYHVDHIIPLKGKEVTGLHCLDNLQIILASDNIAKSNKVLEV